MNTPKDRYKDLRTWDRKKLIEFAINADISVRETAGQCLEKDKTIKDLEETLAKKDQTIGEFGKFLDDAHKRAERAEADRAQILQDFHYEIERRVFAENKLHIAERALMEVSSHNGIQEHKIAMQKVGIRVDRHGSAS